MRILHVIGARPNFMKAAPVVRALDGHGDVEQLLVHTGQHYDFNMSEVFFQELGLPAPDVNLGIGPGSHAQQTSQIVGLFETVVLRRRPDLVVVYGDVNSTLAATLVCAKLMVPVAHVEAGLRCWDRSMPEEVNRVVTDQLSDILFTPSEDGNRNLMREGADPSRVHFVGNVMIDTLARMLPKALQQLPNFATGGYALVTLHRPSNVDDSDWLRSFLEGLEEISHELPIIFPVHPRTRRYLEKFESQRKSSGLRLIEPAPYLECLALQSHARAVITDSGGIQEETTFLGVPCLTVRENTERPITVTIGTNTVIGRDVQRLKKEIEHVLAGRGKRGAIPPLWDGCAASRIAAIITGGSPTIPAGQSARQPVMLGSS